MYFVIVCLPNLRNLGGPRNCFKHEQVMLPSNRRIKPMCIPRGKHSEEHGNRHKSRFGSFHPLEEDHGIQFSEIDRCNTSTLGIGAIGRGICERSVGCAQHSWTPLSTTPNRLPY